LLFFITYVSLNFKIALRQPLLRHRPAAAGLQIRAVARNDAVKRIGCEQFLNSKFARD
jgi:hypothetical protein